MKGEDCKNRYAHWSREELIARLEGIEKERVQNRLEIERREKLQQEDRAQEKLAILKAAVNVGDSLIWEYDVKRDAIHVDYELNSYATKKPSRLKIEQFTKKEDFLRTIYPDDRQEVYYNHFLPLIRGEISSYSICYRRLYKDEILWVEANVQPFQYDAEGRPSRVVYYLSDITEKKLLQDKLYQLQNKYQKIIQALPDTVIVVTKEGKVVDLYTGTEQSLAYNEDCQIGKNIDRLFDSGKAGSMKQIVNQVFDTQKEMECHFRIENENGRKFYYNRIIPFEENSVLVMCRDVSQYIKNEQELAYMNGLMRAILNNIPVCVNVKKIDDDFKFVYLNMAAQQFTGLPAAEMYDKTDFDIFSNQQWAQYLRKADLDAVEKGQTFEFGVNYVTPGGENKIVNVIRLVIDNMENDLSPLLVSLIWDITREKKNEVELVKVKEADSLKTAFLANMSHEIRTPLNAIIGFSNVLSETDDEEERNEYLEIIHKNNELLLHLIDDILDFSKIESNMLDLAYKEIDLKNLCLELYAVHSLKMKSGVRMIFDPAHPSLLVYTDENRLLQVLSNLLSNAIKFTEVGSITLDYYLRNKEVYIRVKDTGIGVAKEDKCCIFDRFVKLNTYTQGTGLGLPISKMIIERLGGKIGMDSEVGKGSTFWIVLPLKRE